MQGIAHRIAREIFVGAMCPGIGSGALPDGPEGIIPESVETFRRVRIFMKREVSEYLWRDQDNWIHDFDLGLVNARIRYLNPNPWSTTPGGRTDVYGSK